MVSIIIPVYNVDNYLNECLDTVVKQTYSDLEIILVDDGSTDESGNICDEWAAKDRRIIAYHKENGGLSSARNYGLDKANGEYISFIDSDDLVSHNMIQCLLHNIECSRASIAAAVIKIFYDDINNTKSFYKQNPKLLQFSEYLKLILEHKIDNACWNKLYRKEIINGIRFKCGVINEDTLFMVDLLRQDGSIFYSDEGTYYYRMRAGSITQQANPKIFQFITNGLYIKDILPSDYKNVCEAYIYYECVNLISTVYKYNNDDEFRKEIRLCRKIINENIYSSMANPHWSFVQKFKYFLVAYMPSIYKSLLRIFR